MTLKTIIAKWASAVDWVTLYRSDALNAMSSGLVTSCRTISASSTRITPSASSY